MRLTWADIDLEHELLIVRKDKRGQTKILPLSEPALEILRAQPLNPGGNRGLMKTLRQRFCGF